MKRIYFVLIGALAALITISCQKENNTPLEVFSVPEPRVYESEENEGPYHQKVKDIDALVSTLGPIFADYNANSLFKEVLTQSVIETAQGDDTYYCFPIEEYHNVTYKVLTKFNQSREIVELGIIRIDYNGGFLAEFYDARAGLEDFKGVITSYDFDEFMSERRNELEECAKIVFCDENNSGGTTGIDPNPGNDDGSVGNDDGGFKNTGVIFINDGSTSGGTILVAQTRCGCAPSHIGGRSNSSCSCRKPDIIVFVPIIHTLKKDTEIHTRDDYFDCIDMLLSVGLISDVEILAKRLKDCDMANDPYDVESENTDCGHGASTDGSDQNNNDIYPDTEFCLEWLAYRDACLSNNTGTNNAWGHFMLNHNSLFNSVISDPGNCVSTEEMEEIICVKNAIDKFEEDFDLNLTKAEKKAIEGEANCGDGFTNVAWSIYLYTKGIVDEETKNSIAENGIYDDEGRVIIVPIDWSTATDQEKVNHLYKNLRYVYYMLVCKDGNWPENNISHSYSINEFFTNFTGTGDFWIANDNISVQALDKSWIEISSFSIIIQNMTTGSDLINVLGSNTAPPTGNGSDLYSFNWPRGGTNNPNTAVIDIRADQNTINALAEDFYIPCN